MERKEVLNDLFYLKGRMNRCKYIYYTILTLFIGFVTSTIGLIAYYNFYIGEIGLTIILGVTIILAIYIGITTSIKRIRDIDKPLWWIILLFIPVIDIIISLILYIKKGTNKVNRYGEESLENIQYTKSMLISSCIFVIIMAVISTYFIVQSNKLDESIDIVKSTTSSGKNQTIEEYIENKVEDIDPYFIDGWYSEKVYDNVYMVSFDFDMDNQSDNGYSCYPYEVNLDTKEVIEISSKEKIREYKSYGYFYNTLCTNQFENEEK